MPSPEAPGEIPPPMPEDEPAPAPEDAQMETPDAEMPVPEEEPMTNDMGAEGGEDVDNELLDMIQSLSPKDQESAKKYIESMMDNNTEAGSEAAPGAQMESFIFTKGQLDECFAPGLDEPEKTARPERKKKETKRTDPFRF